MPLSIFLVEDDPVLRDSLVALLDSSGVAKVIDTAASEHETLAWLGSGARTWDLMVLDLALAGGTGFGVLRKMEALDRERVIVLTNSATDENRAHCRASGASAVFDKTTELAEFLDHCAARRQARRSPAVHAQP
ncbi:response regulator transcription factor [uncultured Variovorax sp.]|uniref:response regulator transcription factor n=1 Tax=uncultured Variovorax sp. TaxID=114708 RepID=UPI0025DE26D1|nr:response regulator [uncultured Variovorax sp.]